MNSQEVSIDQVKETVTLTKRKTIDVAKIIRNEKRLTDINKELQETVRKQDSIIQSLANKNINGLDKINRKNAEIQNLYKSIQRFSNLQLDYEARKKQKPSSLFIVTELEYLPHINSYMTGIGAIYFGERLGYGLKIGLYDKGMFYGLKLAISIF